MLSSVLDESSNFHAGRTSLIARAKRGNREAFELLIRQHEKRVLSTALHLLGHLEDAQDASQLVFLRLFRYLKRFDEERDLAAWLYRITVNVCRDVDAKRRRAGYVPLDDIREPTAATGGEGEALDDRRILARALKGLTETERAAVVLRDIRGLSIREVAEILGSSDSTVRSHLSRARVKLKAYRERAYGREP